MSPTLIAIAANIAIGVAMTCGLAYFLPRSDNLQVWVAITMPWLILAQGKRWWTSWQEDRARREAWHAQSYEEKMRQAFTTPGSFQVRPATPEDDNQPPPDTADHVQGGTADHVQIHGRSRAGHL